MDIMWAQYNVVAPYELERILAEAEKQLNGLGQFEGEYASLKGLKLRSALSCTVEEEGSEEEEGGEEEEGSEEAQGSEEEEGSEEEKGGEEEKEIKKGGWQSDGFEHYDPVIWATATEEETVDEIQLEKSASEINLSHTDEAVPELPGIPTISITRDPEDVEKNDDPESRSKPAPVPEFVRALKDSKMNTRPYFKKGHILRVIKGPRPARASGELNRSGVDG